MKKNQFNTLCVCLTFVISSGDCFGMENNSPDSKKTVINLNGISDSERSTASNSPKSDDRSIGKTEEEEWIEKHEDLINRACYDENQFEELLNKLESDKCVAYYDTIVTQWNGKNVFDSFHNNEHFTASFKKDIYNW